MLGENTIGRYCVIIYFCWRNLF